MARTVRALVIDKPGEHRMVTGPVAEPGPGEVRVAVHAVGLSPADREVYEGARTPDRVRYPITPGHEWAGTVEAVGEGVDPGLLGRRTVGEGVRTCRSCERCLLGAGSGCARGYAATGFTEPGACADVLLVPAAALHLLDDDADLRAAALLAPAAGVAAAVLAAGPLPGDRVAVVGGGTCGLLAVQLLAGYSPGTLHLVDPWPERAARAREFGASATLSPLDAGPLYGRCEVVLVVGGPAAGLTDACRLVRPGGRVVLHGPFEPDGHGLDVSVLTEGPLTLRSVPEPTGESWRYVVRAFRCGLLDPGPLVTDELSLEDFPRALPLLDESAGERTKVLLRP